MRAEINKAYVAVVRERLLAMGRQDVLDSIDPSLSRAERSKRPINLLDVILMAESFEISTGTLADEIRARVNLPADWYVEK